MNMARLVATGSILCALTAFTPASADLPGEVEAGRANARAGGPVSEHDAELVERWGCLSGTRNPVCERGNQGRRYYRERRPERR
jgi:hypothetical protein